MRRDNKDFSKTARTDDFEERIVQIKRISKKSKGGSSMAFAALAVVGDKKGKVGMGYARALDVTSAVAKALSTARKDMVDVKIKNGTIPHSVENKYGAAKIFMKPAPKGSGIIAGGVVRIVMELAGVADVSSKMLGSSNKICNVKCALEAFKKLK